jgi:hypothetical protein
MPTWMLIIPQWFFTLMTEMFRTTGHNGRRQQTVPMAMLRAADTRPRYFMQIPA